MSGPSTDMASSIEAELYATAIMETMPRTSSSARSDWKRTGSELSINSLAAVDLTPTSSRRMNPLTKAVDTLTRNAAPPKFSRLSLSNVMGGGAGARTLGASQGSLVHHNMHHSVTLAGARGSARFSDEPGEALGAGSFLQRTRLYIIGDKHQLKGRGEEARTLSEVNNFI